MEIYFQLMKELMNLTKMLINILEMEDGQKIKQMKFFLMIIFFLMAIMIIKDMLQVMK